MALLSNKTAIECMLGNFEKNDIKRIYNPAVETLVSHSEFRNSHFAFAMDPFLKKKLSSIGIELFPNGYLPHSHPFSKTLENHILYVVLPSVINADPFLFCSIKESKLTCIGAKQNLTLLNEIVEGRDVSRYKEVDFIHNFKFNSSASSFRFSNQAFRTLGRHKSFFFHDEVHHWSKKDLFSFLNKFQPRRLVFSVVYPPEILGGYNNSQNPKMYTFKIIKDKLFFFPDGVTSEGYQQPANLYWLFKNKYLVDGDRCWTIIRHTSKYAHPLFEIVPGRLITEDSFFFNDFDVVDMHHMFKNRFKRYDLFPVNYQHVYKVYSYLLCLKKPDVESGLAKLRQIIGDDVEVKEFLFFEQLCKRFIERGTSYGMFGHTLFEFLFGKFIKSCPNVFVRWTKTWKCTNIFDFLYDLGTLCIQVDRGTCYAHILEHFPFEVVPLDSSVFLDPLPFFESNENFNTERVDDGFLERVKLPFFNYKGDPRKKEAYHFLSEQLHRESYLRTSGCGEKEKVLQICWRTDDHRFVNFSRAVVGSQEKDDVKHFQAYKKLMNFLVEKGEIYTTAFIDQKFDEFLRPEDYESCLNESPYEAVEEEKGESEDQVGGKMNSFTLSLDGLLSEGAEVGQSPEEKDNTSAEIRKPNSEPASAPECNHLIPISCIPYANMYKECECHASHGKKIDVPADGNCFFHAIIETYECIEDHVAMRADFAEWLKRRDPTSNLGDKIAVDGAFMEHELIYLFAISRGLKIIVHFDEKVFQFGEGESEGHLFCDGHHFMAYETYTFESMSANLMDGIEGHYNQKLDKYNFVQDDFLCHSFRGRKAAFLTKVGADYGHNGMIYPTNNWVPSLDEIIEICDPGMLYNSALIQWYEENASLGLHRDNEVVYSDEKILTVNLKGSCVFRIEAQKQLVEFEMLDSSFFIMPKGFQKRARHGVTATSQRVSITFRVHTRFMNGKPIKGSEMLKKKKNKCLIVAVSNCLKSSEDRVAQALIQSDKSYWLDFFRNDSGASIEDCANLAECLKLNLEVHTGNEIKVMNFGQTLVRIKYESGHFSELKSFANMPRSSFSHLQGKSNVSAVRGLIDKISKTSHYNLLNFNANGEYFQILRKSFLQRTTGVVLGEVLDNGAKYFAQSFKLSEECHNISTELHCLVGFAGSGKSKVMQDWLNSVKKSAFCVVSPRVVLTSDWVFKLGMEGRDTNKVCTFESFIKRERSKLELIVIDEVTLFPNGYIDWLIYDLQSSGSKAEVVLLFDPLQARYHNDSDCNILNFEHDVDRLVNDKEVNYLYGSFRLNKNFFGRFNTDLPTASREESDAKIWVINSPEDIRGGFGDRTVPNVILVDSQVEKKMYESQFRTLTFGESQGLTFEHVCIALSESTAASNDLRWNVAWTRAKERVSFLVSHLGGLEDFLINCKADLPKKILNGEKLEHSFYRKMVRSKLLFKDLVIGGSQDEMDREERLEGDPFLKPFIFLGQRVNIQEVEMETISLEEPRCQTHLYISEPNFAQSYNFDLIRLKEEREYREDMLVTDQFCDNYNKRGPKCDDSTVGPFRFKAIYPKHSHDDDMTFWMAVKKRLVFRSEDENRRRLNDAHLIGGLIYRNFKRSFDLKFTHDQGLLESCINDFEVKKLKKSQATIKSHSIRSDVDWALNDVFLFMKSQLCTKFEKQFVDAKAGQTLACFQHLILVQFAPWCRYLEQQIRDQLPEEIYIHSNKNFDDLNAWVKRFFMRDVCVESDYEAFDACQDEYILSFEIHLMKDAGLPDELVDAYIDLKCKLSCKLGHFAVMRFTGEFCTFLFNTLANMAFTMCRYEWRRGQPIAFAGDDMCALNDLPLRYDFEEVFERISLKAKVERTERPTFCGWRLTPYGIVKEPELVYNRFQVAIEEGKVMECLENYAIEVSYAYNLSERLYEVLKSERQIQYHQAVVRFIVTHIDKLKTKEKDLFQEQSSDEDI
uniref:Replicase n=1 Tax=Peony yellowing associated citrivirus TaxID=2800955 RepID=A0A7L7QU79_9VIRU|nr:replicase [Peony yellowing associated citrivirus]